MPDKMLRLYSARAATRRWPVAVFYNILDMAAMNACVLYCGCMGINMAWRAFILELCKELCSEHITRPTHPHTAQTPHFPTMPEEKRRNCGVKRKCTKSKTTKNCMMCQQCTTKVYSVCGDC